MEQRIAQLEALVAELTEWKRKREMQQISYPLDEASVNALGAVVKTGVGTGRTETVALSGESQNITVVERYDGVLTVKADGATYIIGYYNP